MATPRPVAVTTTPRRRRRSPHRVRRWPAVAADAKSPRDGTSGLQTGHGTAAVSGAVTADYPWPLSSPASPGMEIFTARRITIGN